MIEQLTVDMVKEAAERNVELSFLQQHLDVIKEKSMDEFAEELREKEKFNKENVELKENREPVEIKDKSPMELGNEIHKQIQFEEIENKTYDSMEVTARDISGEVLQRERVIDKGARKGEVVYEGTRYDLYKETESVIKTGEIKPFTESGIAEALKKYDLQKEIEEKLGGNHGKEMQRELILYDQATGKISLRGDYESTINKAKEILKNI